ncbi:peptidylprolyl isomerase [bacterium]|nr:peptidylprolyl isomerase [bacterium]MBU1957736.1 peptidylprolyl isomerase [bacterium]
MISWMQKNNKFLIITIWIATISFIFTGATYGFSYGLKSNSIGKVGSVNLKRDRFAMEYNNLFNRYNQMMQGKFDNEQAKKMGLEQQVLNSMATQAKVLNLAKEFGVVATDEETGTKLASFPAFQTNGQFDRSVYDTFIKNSAFQQDTFEDSLRDQIIIEKTLDMLTSKGLENEYKAFGLAFEVADKFKYHLLSENDVNVSIDESKLKEFWEPRKEHYQTAKKYTLDIQWTETKDTNVTEAEIQTFYNENKFNYTDKEGKILPLADIKDWLTDDVKVKNSNKLAYKRYLQLKKGDLLKTETLTLDLNDPKLSKELWTEITNKAKNDLLKPKVVGKKYAAVKIVDIVEPVTKTFDEVKETITPIYKTEANKEALSLLAEKKLSTIDTDETNVSNFVTLENAEKQKIGINQQEMVDFVSKLFTSNQEKGIIPIGSKVIVYKIVEQKLVSFDNNNSSDLYKSADQVKKQSFETSLIKKLDKMYPTEFYK